MKPHTMLALVSGIALGTVSVQLRASSSLDDNRGSATADAQSEYERLIAPCVQKAHSTYPQAKKRYLAGLPTGDRFYVMTRIKDPAGTSEYVYVLVAAMDEQKHFIAGQLASPLKQVKTYRPQQPISFSETEVLDWAIVKRDGSEEGDYVGRFVDEVASRAARKAWGENGRALSRM